MATVNNNWKDCGLDLNDYKLVKLEPGNQESHLDFVTSYQVGKQRGFSKSEEKIKEEAEAALRKKEAKIMSMDID